MKMKRWERQGEGERLDQKKSGDKEKRERKEEERKDHREDGVERIKEEGEVSTAGGWGGGLDKTTFRPSIPSPPLSPAPNSHLHELLPESHTGLGTALTTTPDPVGPLETVASLRGAAEPATAQSHRGWGWRWGGAGGRRRTGGPPGTVPRC